MAADRPWRDLPVDALLAYGAAAESRGKRLGTSADLAAAIDAYTHLKSSGALPVESWPALADCHRVLGKLTGGRHHLDSAVALAEELLSVPADEWTGRDEWRQYLLALTLRSRYEVYDEAADLERSLRITEELVRSPHPWADPGDWAMAANVAANNYQSRFLRGSRTADLEAAVSLRRRAIKRLQSAEPLEPGYRLAGLTHGLGADLLTLHEHRGDSSLLTEALQALRFAVANMPRQDPSWLGLCSTLGHALLRNAKVRLEEDSTPQGRAAATPLIDEVVELFDVALPPERRGSALARIRALSLAEALLVRHQASQQLEDLDRALTVTRRGLDGAAGSRLDADLLLRMAEAYRLRNEATGAQSDLEHAVAAYRECCSWPDSANAARDAHQWGSWAMSRGAWSEAAEAYGHALLALRVRHERQQRPRHKEEWLRDSQFVPARAAYAMVRNGQPERAAAAAEQGRALLLAEALQRETADLAALRRQGLAALAERFEAARDRLAAFRDGPGEDPDAEAEAATALDAAVSAIRNAGHEDFLLLPGTAPVRDSASKASLVYLFAAEPGGAAVIVPPGDAPIRSVLLDGADLRTATEKANTHLVVHQNRRPGPAWEQHLDDLTRWCWTYVMGPVLKELPPVQPYVLIPSGPLAFLPLHAAWEPARDSPTGRRYALDVVSLSYAPSATVLRAATRKAAAGHTARPDSGTLAGRHPVPLPAVGVHDPADGQLRLPFAELEIDAMISVLGPHGVRLWGQEATRDAVLDQLSRAGTVHFACHGTAHLHDPLSSCLFLTDGPLTVREIRGRRGASSRLAVLSGCETGLVGTALPDEAVGLPAACIEAGFSAVIASLWSVHDIATALLMARFYQLCGHEGLLPPEALRQAQRWVRDATNAEKAEAVPSYGRSAEGMSPVEREFWGSARAHVSPYYWAAFTYTGAGLDGDGTSPAHVRG
ncbi:CHAT domain-containing protein [Streptantibioticus ferralitis]|uniref:CHAT domain-containing protein n=1 Tax=Streptantibioticus ferralitis TaxID=236510 RepID=A0ABT5ZC34_9ACTN|nr:CHAT domain-containing protein [Streptantibioticus ferralitis]MDF2261398.1 CHAT domain-containing protein [Streptantibioticus ferralitis]